METSGIVSGLSTALTTVKADMIDAVTTVLPFAVAVGGTILVVTLGWKLFKRLSK